MGSKLDGPSTLSDKTIRSCNFCDIDGFRAAELSIENALCIYASGDSYDRSEGLAHALRTVPPGG